MTLGRRHQQQHHQRHYHLSLLFLTSFLAIMLPLPPSTVEAWTTTTSASFDSSSRQRQRQPPDPSSSSSSSSYSCSAPPYLASQADDTKEWDDVSADTETTDDLSSSDSRSSITGSPSSDTAATTRRRWVQNVARSTVTLSSLGLASPAAMAKLPPVSKSPAVCDATVSVWKRNDDRLVYLLGTAHISQVSAELAGSLVRDVHPNAVFVELDAKRVAGVLSEKDGDGLPVDAQEAMKRANLVIPPPPTEPLAPVGAAAAKVVAAATTTGTDSTSDDSAVTVASPVTVAAAAKQQPSQSQNWFQRKLTNFAARAVGSAIQGMYANLGTQGFQPGDEFVTAVREGQSYGAATILGDRDVEVTLQRLTQALAVTNVTALIDPQSDVSQSMAALGPDTDSMNRNDPNDPAVLAAYVERLKSRESVRGLVAQLQQVAPALVQVMLTERDFYMARGIDTVNQFETIVAVMGLAHQDGVEENLRARGWTPVVVPCGVAR